MREHAYEDMGRIMQRNSRIRVTSGIRAFPAAADEKRRSEEAAAAAAASTAEAVAAAAAAAEAEFFPYQLQGWKFWSWGGLLVGGLVGAHGQYVVKRTFLLLSNMPISGISSGC